MCDICITSDDFFFQLGGNIGYIFKKPEIIIATVKIEYQLKNLFSGNKASNVTYYRLKYS